MIRALLALALLLALPAFSPLAAGGPSVTEEAWPRQGSVVRYAVSFGEQAPGCCHQERTTLDVTFTYRSGAWSARCEGWTTLATGEGERRSRVMQKTSLAPPVATDAPVPVLRGCGLSTLPVGAAVPHEYEGIAAWRAAYEPECRCQAGEATWASANGLVLAWSFAGRTTAYEGRLVGTDAPLR